jgi:hypothetical protein
MNKEFLVVLVFSLALALFAPEVFSITSEDAVPELTLEVIPNSVEISKERPIEILVVARNPGKVELNDFKLSWFSDAVLIVKVSRPEKNILAPHGALAWTLQLSHTEGMPVAGTIHLRIDYAWHRKEPAESIPCLKVTSIKVAAREPEIPEQVIEIQLKTSLKSLMENRPGNVYLLINNISNVPIRITKITPTLPPLLTSMQEDLSTGKALGPRRTITFPVKVEVPGAVVPGDYILLFEVEFEWEKSGQTWKGSSVVSHEVNVGVLGESDILTAVGVPSFLFLPGFLMVITFGLLWKLFAHKSEYPLKVKTPEFWLVAISLSILAALIYPIVTGWIDKPRDYLKGYMLNDIVWIWGASVVFSMLSYLVLIGGSKLVILAYESGSAAWEERKKRERTPSDTDDPITILRKLHKQNLGINLPRANVVIREQPERAYLLEPQTESQTKIWVGPNIVIKWLSVTDELYQKVREQLGVDGDANVLAELLEQGKKKKLLLDRWKHEGQLAGPHEVDNGTIDVIEAGLIIEEE